MLVQLVAGDSEVTAGAVDFDLPVVFRFLLVPTPGPRPAAEDLSSGSAGGDFGIGATAVEDDTGPRSEFPGLRITAVVEVDADEPVAEGEADPVKLAVAIGFANRFEGGPSCGVGQFCVVAVDALRHLRPLAQLAVFALYPLELPQQPAALRAEGDVDAVEPGREDGRRPIGIRVELFL